MHGISINYLANNLIILFNKYLCKFSFYAWLLLFIFIFKLFFWRFFLRIYIFFIKLYFIFILMRRIFSIKLRWKFILLKFYHFDFRGQITIFIYTSKYKQSILNFWYGETWPWQIIFILYSLPLSKMNFKNIQIIEIYWLNIISTPV
jgi:hypothetical protein